MRKTGKTVEQDFGFTPGSRVKRVVIDSRNPQSGGWFESSTDSIRISLDAAYSEKNDQGSIARHEAFHLFYAQLRARQQNASQSDSTLTAFTNSFTKSVDSSKVLLTSLAEESFDVMNPYQAIGGHPWDDISELFASTLNSLYSFWPEQVLQKQTTQFLIWYRDHLEITLLHLKKILENNKAPILSKLEQRIKDVRRIAAQRQTLSQTANP